MRPITAPSRLGAEHGPWLASLETVGAHPRGFPFPDRGELPEIFRRLAVDEADAAEIDAAWPSPEQDGELWWLLERVHHAIARDMGGYEFLPWPSLPGSFGAAGRYFYAYVFLALLGEVRDFHARRGIADEISWATLADFGRNVRRDRILYGEGGLRTQDWLTLHFRGAIYELGRLQFNRRRSRLGESADAADGEPALGIHIPESGPLTPEACEASYRQARAFFARHFPETPVRIATCRSWLLDEQLAEYLDERSNIVQFQRRFTIVDDSWDGDGDILRFVFHRIDPELDDLPQRTTLERAVVTHLRAGRHWRNRLGWIEL